MASGWSIGARYAQIMCTWEGNPFENFRRVLVLIHFTRKNFDRHFQESRHAFGMRALGLPNTKHFHEITRIEDALSRKIHYLAPSNDY